MAAKSKYRKKFTKELLKGLRKDGKSIEEVCLLWGISDQTYQNWRLKYPEFEEAHLIGEMDKKAWWRQLQRQVASGKSAGNAAVINFALKNEAGYVDKQEVHNTHDEKINIIKIEMLPSRNELKYINAEGSESLPYEGSS